MTDCVRTIAISDEVTVIESVSEGVVIVSERDVDNIEIDTPAVDLQVDLSDPVALLISETGAQGAVGPAGPSGSITFVKTADQALSGHRVVRSTSESTVDYCDVNTIGHLDSLLGITTGAALSGAETTVVASGELTELSWTWTPGEAIFCGPNGVLTQAYDSSWAWVRIVAFAMSATSIVVQLREPIIQS